MDYEKMYNEALEDMRAIYPNLKGDAKIAVEHAFPELAESEDERIRKLLVWQVHRNIEDETNDLAQSVYDGIKGHDPDIEESIEDWKKCLAWLERQKEPKHDATDAKSERVIKAARSVLNNWLDGTDCPDVSGDFAELEYAIREYDGEEKQKEQKPAEWSEENKEKIVTISEIIEHCTTIPYSGGTLTLNKEYKKELLCFIKSLRPQYHGDVTMTEAYKMGLEAGKASSWKPSEHQMNILKAVKDYVGAGSGYWGEALGSLIEDLEKL